MDQKIVLGKCVLVADDERQVREAIAMLLSLDDHQVMEVANGAEALDQFTKGKRKFDLVITDFEMPVLKGNELAVKIRQLAPKQPIIMITAYREKIGPENPVDIIINKPFTLEDLRRAIAKLLA